MQIPKTIPFAILMALPRTAASYAAYVITPLLTINWSVGRSVVKLVLLVGFFAIALGLNALVGTKVSPMAWLLELALFLPFLLAVFGFSTVRGFDGRSFIKVLNLLGFIGSLISLARMGFPFQLPYVHYLPDVYDGGYGAGGAKIITVIGFFGLIEGLTNQRGLSLRRNWSLYLAALNFIMPSFILGIVAGAFALSLFARRNRVLLIAGSAIALVAAPYIIFRAEVKNNSFAEHYGSNPKLYALKIVGDVYLDEPQALLIGAGLGQFASEPAMWATPVKKALALQNIPDVPFLKSADVHIKHIAPILMRFRKNAYAIESSANKPYSGFSILLIETGLPFSIVVVYLLYVAFWRRKSGNFGRSAFLFAMSINFLDPNFDSPWFGVLMIAVLQVIRADASCLADRVSSARSVQGMRVAEARTNGAGSI